MKPVDRWPLGVLVVTPAAFVFGVLWRRSLHDLGQPSYDIYGFFYPNQVYAWRSLRAGAGLLWNPYQDCGAPFFAMSQVGLLYPVNLLFAALDREAALLASGLVNLSITGAGTFLLGRGLGLNPLPALCAAFAFQLGWVATWLTSWSPIHIAALAWLPVALWRTELLVRRPTGRHAIALAAVLALAHLPGFYQTGFYIYQLIALRLAWACVVQRADRPLRLLALAVAGLVASFLLDAVQVLPAIEVTRQSLRSLQLEARDVGGGFTWAHLAEALTAQVVFPGNAAIVLLAVVALVGAGQRRSYLASRISPDRSPPSDEIRDTSYESPPQWNSVFFYWAVALVYFVLSLGPGSLLYELYELLPLGSAFRGAWRLVWVTNFALAMLAGWGAEALLHAPGSMARTVGTGVLLVGAVVLHWLVPDGLHAGDALIVLGVAGTAWAAHGSPRREPARWLVPVLIAVSCLVIARPPLPMFGLRRGDIYSTHAAALAAVGERLTAQDRVMIVGGFPDFALMPKSSSLFRLPGIFDYDTLASRSYVEFFTYMRTGRRLRTLQDWYWIVDRQLLPTMQRRLFDLTAARYLIVDRRADRVDRALHGGVQLVSETDALRVYENRQALPRARYVPRVVVVAGEDDALAQLAGSPLDPREVAWVSATPRSGFVGSGGSGTGSAAIISDEAERVVVRVQAAQPGFLVLADQYFPGWRAEVNGSEAEIVRANVTFRAVEVPAGDSEVVLVYRPFSVRLGALISLVALAIMAVLWRRTQGRRPHPEPGR